MTFDNEVPLAYKPLTWEIDPYQPYYIMGFHLFINKQTCFHCIRPDFQLTAGGTH